MPDVEVDFDFGNAELSIPDEGYYRVQVLGPDDGKNKEPVIELNKNEDGYNLVTNLMIVDCPDEEFDNSFIIKNWTSLKSNAMWSAKSFLEALLQRELTEKLNMETMADLADELVGHTVIIIIKHNKFEGQIRANMKSAIAEENFEGSGEGIFIT